MARKSRRNKSTEVNISQDIVKNKNLLDTAAYVRLSVENGGNETDETLVVQQMLVEKYIEEHPDSFTLVVFSACWDLPPKYSIFSALLITAWSPPRPKAISMAIRENS